MKIGELIQRVQSLYSKGVQSDDTRLSNRHIYNKLLTVRSLLVSQKVNKKQRVSSWLLQTMPCVEIVKVPKHQCPCLPPVGCDIYRSKFKLPKPVSGLNGHMIQQVTTIDRSTKIDEVAMSSINYRGGNKYTAKKMNFFIDNGFLYLTLPTKIKAVSVTGLFEDPFEVSNFKGLCDSDTNADCIDIMEQEFPLEADKIDTLIELSVKELVEMFSNMREDITNNTRDSHIQQSK